MNISKGPYGTQIFVQWENTETPSVVGMNINPKNPDMS